MSQHVIVVSWHCFIATAIAAVTTFESHISGPQVPNSMSNSFLSPNNNSNTTQFLVPPFSTGILTSSFPEPSAYPALQRTTSTFSERVPIGAVPTISLTLNRDPCRTGRFSNSSDYGETPSKGGYYLTREGQYWIFGGDYMRSGREKRRKGIMLEDLKLVSSTIKTPIPLPAPRPIQRRQIALHLTAPHTLPAV